MHFNVIKLMHTEYTVFTVYTVWHIFDCFILDHSEVASEVDVALDCQLSIHIHTVWVFASQV